MLPFLKNRNDAGAEDSSDKVVRDHDEGFDMLDAVAGDILEAIKSSDKDRLKQSLGALVDHIKDLDAQQDQEIG